MPSWWRHQMKTFSALLVDRWIPLTKASDAELWCFLWSAPEQTVVQTIDSSVIWDAMGADYDVTVMMPLMFQYMSAGQMGDDLAPRYASAVTCLWYCFEEMVQVYAFHIIHRRWLDALCWTLLHRSHSIEIPVPLKSNSTIAIFIWMAAERLRLFSYQVRGIHKLLSYLCEPHLSWGDARQVRISITATHCVRSTSGVICWLKRHKAVEANQLTDGAAMKWKLSLIARFMGPTCGPSGADRTQVGPMLAPWTLLSGLTP